MVAISIFLALSLTLSPNRIPSIIRGKYESGPAYVYGVEFLAFIVLGVCYTRLTSSNIGTTSKESTASE